MDKTNRTAVVEARVDLRDLATCAKFLVEHGSIPTSRSDLVWRIVSSMAQTLAMSGEQHFVSTESAMGYLDQFSFGSWNRTNRSGRPMNIKVLSQALDAERGQEAMLSSFTQEDIRQALSGAIGVKACTGIPVVDVSKYRNPEILVSDDTDPDNAAQRAEARAEQDRQKAEQDRLDTLAMMGKKDSV